MTRKNGLICCTLLFSLTAAPLLHAQEPAPLPLPFPEASPSPEPYQVDGYSFTAMLGGTVSMSSNAETKLAPIARLQVSGPLALGGANPDRLPRLHVTADLEALPGDTIDQAGGIGATLEQFKALRFTVGISQRISKWQAFGAQSVATSIYADAGFATRLDGEQEPRDKAPRFTSFGVRFDERTSGSFLKLGVGPDQRLDGTWQLATHIDGYVRAYALKSGAAEMGLLMRAILGIDASSPSRPGLTGGRRDSVNVGFVAGF